MLPIAFALLLFNFVVIYCCIRRRNSVARRRQRSLLDDHHKPGLGMSASLNGKLNGLLNSGNGGTLVGLGANVGGGHHATGPNGHSTSNSSCSNQSNGFLTRNNIAPNQRYPLEAGVEMSALLSQQQPGTPHYGHQQHPTYAGRNFGQQQQQIDAQHQQPPQMSSSSSSNGSSNGRAHTGRTPTEYPMSAIRFLQELGEGAFGKVYRGELLMGNGGPLVVPIAIKTLKENSTIKTKTDFRREADLMAELQHPNIVCLMGVCFSEEPMCMLFEYMRKGDLHEYLVSHGPGGQFSPPIDALLEAGDGPLDVPDCLHIATQIAAGMEYLSNHHYVHRDLAARNCLVGEHLTVKISDFGLSRDIYSSDYYRVQSKSLLPVR